MVLWSLSNEIHSVESSSYLRLIEQASYTQKLRRGKFHLFVYCFFTIYSRYLKRVISKSDGCEYLKQVPSSDGSWSLSNEIHSVESSSYFRIIEQTSYTQKLRRGKFNFFIYLLMFYTLLKILKESNW
jgi:hypothetical protein